MIFIVNSGRFCATLEILNRRQNNLSEVPKVFPIGARRLLNGAGRAVVLRWQIKVPQKLEFWRRVGAGLQAAVTDTRVAGEKAEAPLRLGWRAPPLPSWSQPGASAGS